MLFTFVLLAVQLGPVICSSFESMMESGCLICLLVFLVLQRQKARQSPEKNEMHLVLSFLFFPQRQNYSTLVFVEKRRITHFVFMPCIPIFVYLSIRSLIVSLIWHASLFLVIIFIRHYYFMFLYNFLGSIYLAMFNNVMKKVEHQPVGMWHKCLGLLDQSASRDQEELK